MGTFSAFKSEWNSAEECLEAFFEEHHFVHLGVLIPMVGGCTGAKAYCCHFISKDMLKNRVYRLSFANCYLLLEFLDVVHIRDIPNRSDSLKARYAYVRLNTPMPDDDLTDRVAGLDFLGYF